MLASSRGKTIAPSDEIPPPDTAWRAAVMKLDETHHPKVEMLAKCGEWFCRASQRNNRSKGHWLVLAGSPGCGKTHVAEKVRGYITQRQIDAYSRGWLSGELHAPAFLRWDRVCKMDDDDFDAVVDRVVKPARVVILDDVGAEIDQFKNGAPIVRLKAILDDCERKWLLMTTNISKPDWAETFGARITDRLKEARYLGLFEVPSYRGTRREESEH